MTDRTPADYAIEHAEYMAKAAEAFMNIVGPLISPRLTTADHDLLTDHRQALASGIYEFRKRATRVDGETRNGDR